MKTDCFKIFVLLLSLLCPILPVYSKTPKLKKFVEGEVLIKYKENKNFTFQTQLIQKFGAKKIKRLNSKGLSHVKLVKGQTTNDAITYFSKDPNVEFVQPNYIYRASTLPNDSMFSQMWGLKNSGQTIAKAATGPDNPEARQNPPSSFTGNDLAMESAWDTHTDCSSIVVAVIDSGINYNHQDLASNMWNGGAPYPNHGYDFVDNDNNPMDQNGHGTHVAGTIGAVGNNGLGITGVCWKANLMALRSLDSIGSGTTQSIIQSIDFAVTNGAKIINMSLGGGGPHDPAFNAAITSAETNGVLVVAAAGNDNSNNDITPNYPCNFTDANVLCVAALDQDYSLAAYSNYGSTSVDIGAPGTNILSTWPGPRQTLIADSLTAGWNFSSTTANAFGYGTYFAYDTLNSNISSANYSNNTDDRAWKTFDLSMASFAILNFYIKFDLESYSDFLVLYGFKGAGDPIDSGEYFDFYTGDSGGYVNVSQDITKYVDSNTSLGFNLVSDDSGNATGASVLLFSIDTINYNNSTYNVISGTSMATPNTAGVAALVWSYNPDYTYLDVINALKGGGIANSSLAGKTSTGKAVNAVNALAYINAPSGGTAVKLP